MAKKYFFGLPQETPSWEKEPLDPLEAMFDQKGRLDRANEFQKYYNKAQDKTYDAANSKSWTHKSTQKVLAAATILGGATYGYLAKDASLGIAASLGFGVSLEIIREVSYVGGAGVGALLSSQDDAVKNRLSNVDDVGNLGDLINKRQEARKTVRKYCMLMGTVASGVSLFYGAPPALEFAKDKLQPLFANNTQMTDAPKPLLAEIKDNDLYKKQVSDFYNLAPAAAKNAL